MKTPPFPKRLATLASTLAGVLLACGPSPAKDACGPEALGTSRVAVIDGSQKLALGLQTYPQTLALGDHEVVLTFDDGPSANTSAVLDALEEECVHATFFLIGRNAAALPKLVRRELSEGHTVGHHSMTHPALTLRSMSENAAKEDMARGFQAVDKAAYGAADAQPRTPFFRFPGFADTPALVSWLQSRGIAVFGTDLWASDWQQTTPQAELDLILGRLERARKGIILFHDPRPSTAKMMPDFLRELQRRGYKVVHIVPGEGPTAVQAAGPGWTSTTEAIIAKTLSHHHDATRQRTRPAGGLRTRQPAAKPSPAETEHEPTR